MPFNGHTRYNLRGSCVKNLNPEIAQASKSNYQFVGNIGAEEHVK